jgi:glycosyltransferase involved in cell wall biosynthesis
MEYMASGTPVVTTRLPGMPEEYYDYVFLFDDETVEGFTNTFNNILSLPKITLVEKGLKCKEFVIRRKNNIIQTERVLELLSLINS